jgi:hypothetical protein
MPDDKKTKPSKPKKKKEALYKEPTEAKYGTFGRKGTAFEGDWLKLAKAFGGVQALADAVGVSYSTLHRWAVKGDPVPAPSRRVLAMLAAEKGLPPLPPAGT